MSREEAQQLLSRAMRGDIEATTELMVIDHELGRKALVGLLERDDVWSPAKRVECKYDAKSTRIPSFGFKVGRGAVRNPSYSEQNLAKAFAVA